MSTQPRFNKPPLKGRPTATKSPTLEQILHAGSKQEEIGGLLSNLGYAYLDDGALLMDGTYMKMPYPSKLRIYETIKEWKLTHPHNVAAATAGKNIFKGCPASEEVRWKNNTSEGVLYVGEFTNAHINVNLDMNNKVTLDISYPQHRTISPFNKRDEYECGKRLYT